MPKSNKAPRTTSTKPKAKPRSSAVGAAGLNTAADFKRFATAIAVDVVTGRLGHREAAAAGSQIQSVIKIVELEHRYGYTLPNSKNGNTLLLGS